MNASGTGGKPSLHGESRVLYRSAVDPYPLAVSGSGVYIRDAAGKDYLDMSGGAAVSALGHGHIDIVAAVRRQLESLPFAHTAFFSNEPQETLAAALAGRFAEAKARVYFASGGSEANETALKLAWQYWAARGKPGKKIVISREHSYHGNTFGALSVSGNDARRRASAAPLIDWPRIPPCYAYREQGGAESAFEYGQRAAGYLAAAIERCGADSVAAFIAEPVVGSSLGVVPAVPGYLQRVREICDTHDILLIADEVMCGSGRTGRFFAHENDAIVPDIVTLAKGLGGGYQPLAAVVMRAHVADELASAGFAHGHTYIGHAAACAAGVAVQAVIDRDGLLAKTRERGDEFLDRLDEVFREHPNVGDIRVRGLFAGIEIVNDRDSRRGFDGGPEIARQLRLAALDQGVICYPGGISVDGLFVPHIMLAPPMVITRDELHEGIRRVAAALERTLSDNGHARR